MELNIKLTVAQVQLILAGLGKLPLENSIDVWQSVKLQAEAQLQPTTTPAPEE